MHMRIDEAGQKRAPLQIHEQHVGSLLVQYFRLASGCADNTIGDGYGFNLFCAGFHGDDRPAEKDDLPRLAIRTFRAKWYCRCQAGRSQPLEKVAPCNIQYCFCCRAAHQAHGRHPQYFASDEFYVY